MSRNVVIMRGLPGSGKSSFVSVLENKEPKCKVVSADYYHMLNNEYCFDVKNLEDAHSTCLHNFVWYIEKDEKTLSKEDNSIIVVDNTNTTALEIAPYFRVARAFGYTVHIVEMECSILEAVERNIHDVPESVICKLALNMRVDLPLSWREKYRRYISVLLNENLRLDEIVKNIVS